MSGYKTTYLQNRKGRYYFRFALPLAIAKSSGIKELIISLKTHEPSVARILCREIAAFIHSLLGCMMNATTDNIKKIKELAREHLRFMLMSAEEMLRFPSGAKLERLNFMLEENEYIQQQVLNNKYDHYTKSYAEGGLEKLGITVDEFSDEYEVLCNGIARARLEHNRIVSCLIQKSYAPAPIDSLFTDIDYNNHTVEEWKNINPSPPPVITLEESISRFYALKKESWVYKTRMENERCFKIFVEFIGDPKIPIKNLTVDHCRGFRDIIARIPSNYSKNKNNVGKKILEVLVDPKPGITLSEKTIQKYYDVIKGFINWLVSDGYIDKNIAPTMQKLKKGLSKEDKDPFSSEQLTKLFNSPLYIGHEFKKRHIPGNIISKDAYYWLPLVGLFTGARLGELLQLQTKNLMESDNIYHLSIDEEGYIENNIKKKLKTPSSKRYIPVHPELMKLGFIEYVKNLKLPPESRIFKQISISKSMGDKGVFSNAYSTAFRRYIEHIKIKSDTTSFHSFRHNVKDALKEANLHPDKQNDYLGHLGKSVGEKTYGSIKASIALYEEIKKIKFEVDLSHLYSVQSIAPKVNEATDGKEVTEEQT